MVDLTVASMEYLMVVYSAESSVVWKAEMKADPKVALKEAM